MVKKVIVISRKPINTKVGDYSKVGRYYVVIADERDLDRLSDDISKSRISESDIIYGNIELPW